MKTSFINGTCTCIFYYYYCKHNLYNYFVFEKKKALFHTALRFLLFFLQPPS